MCCPCRCRAGSQGVAPAHTHPNRHCSNVYNRFSLEWSQSTPQGVHPYVFRLVPRESSHCNWLNSTQSSNHPLLIHRGSIASVFLHKGPHLISRDRLGWHRLHLGIMYLLCSLTSSPNDTDDGIVCQSASATKASQTAAFTVSL